MNATRQPSQLEKGEAFRALHERESAFIIPNPWDVVSARLLAGLGFQASATSSAASAGTLGRKDGAITREQAMAHARCRWSIRGSASLRRDLRQSRRG